jgi:hypothetical protein
MKVYVLILLTFFGLTACSSEELKITVSNPTAIDRVSEMVEIPVEKLEMQIPLRQGESYLVRNAKSEIVPSQPTCDGKLIFQSGLKAGESSVFFISRGNRKEFTPLVYCRFIGERKDDFAWENDRVAFRIYGAALIPIDGPSNGLDVWYKRTSKLIIDEWYKKDLAGKASYHDDHGEGLDDYKVGRTLGAGAMAPYVNDTLWLNENFVSYEILENGPLRLTFRLVYKNITVDGISFAESRTFSLDAGAQLTKVRQEYGTDKPIPVAAGIIKRNDSDTVIYDRDNNFVIYPEISPKAGTAFIGMLFPDGIEDVRNTENHFLTITDYNPEQTVCYYTGYGWTKYGFPELSDFKKYMTDFSICLKQPITVGK